MMTASETSGKMQVPQHSNHKYPRSRRQRERARKNILEDKSKKTKKQKNQPP